jgi:hypothetical protein
MRVMSCEEQFEVVLLARQQLQFEEALVKAIHWIIAAAALACTEPVQAAIGDPEVIIYRFPGVTDYRGADNVGVATSFHCTNFSGVTENIRFVTRGSGGNLLTNMDFGIAHLATLTVSTHDTAAYAGIANTLNTGLIAQTAIAATSINIICTAVTMDGASVAPVGVELRGSRFSPIPGSQE